MEVVTCERVVERGADIERVAIDGVSQHGVVVHMQVDDAVATVDGLHSQLEVTVGGIDRHHLHAGGRRAHRHPGGGGRDGHVLVSAVGLCVCSLIEADVDRLASRVFWVNGQQQV